MYLYDHLVKDCKFAEVEFAVTDFTRMKEINAEWVSPPFYSHPQRYKFRLAVYPNGLHAQKGTDMSVCVLIDSLPGKSVEATVHIKLVNFRSEFYGLCSSVSLCSEPDSAGNLVTDTNDYPHSSLVYDSDRNTEYLKDDSVRFKVSLDTDITVIDYPTALLTKRPSWQTVSSSQRSLLEFTLPEFSRRVELLYPYYNCPDFYTHENGYKLHFRVSILGDYIGHECVSVCLKLVSGEYDDQLEWPLVGKFIIELLNWREDRAHWKKKFSVRANYDVNKVPRDSEGEEIISNTFIEYSQLAFDPVWYTEYLYEDCLRFRVTMKQP